MPSEFRIINSLGFPRVHLQKPGCFLGHRLGTRLTLWTSPLFRALCASHTYAGFSFRAMASPATRDQFLRQMEQIVEGIKQSRMKVRRRVLHWWWRREGPGKNRLLLAVLGHVPSVLKTYLHASAGPGPAPRASCTAGPKAALRNISHDWPPALCQGLC